MERADYIEEAYKIMPDVETIADYIEDVDILKKELTDKQIEISELQEQIKKIREEDDAIIAKMQAELDKEYNRHILEEAELRTQISKALHDYDVTIGNMAVEIGKLRDLEEMVNRLKGEKMIAISRYAAYEMLDVIQPSIAMSTGSQTHVQELPIRYVCRRIATFQTNCQPYDTMNWCRHKITAVDYEKFPLIRVIDVKDISYILTNECELKEFIKKMMKGE